MMRIYLTCQSGLILIELMISMVISLILILGVVSIYINSKRGYSLTDGMGREQENARFSLDLLLHDLRMAGYPKNTMSPIVTATDGGTGNSDSITVQYLSPTDCLGQATGGTAINRYFIDGNGNLACLGNGSGTADVIADGIYNMQILYGIDSNNDCMADQYVKWTSVTDQSKIVSVRIGLLSRTPTDSSATDVSNTFTLLDQSISVTDKRIHRVYVNTVVLRNANNPAFPDSKDCPV